LFSEGAMLMKIDVNASLVSYEIIERLADGFNMTLKLLEELHVDN
jgi:hypothetical protein